MDPILPLYRRSSPLQERSSSIRKALYTYHGSTPNYALAWSNLPGRDAFRIACGSFIEASKSNTLKILTLAGDEYDQNGIELAKSCQVETIYPLSKVLWQPYKGGAGGPDLLATSSDMLRLWEVVPDHDGDRIRFIHDLHSSKQESIAPLTSFDWNEHKPSLIVTSSVDTTCTIWNVETKQAKTQLIAHDREVFDVAWIARTSDIFASVGADGSVRMFDLRALDHSSIIYEAPTLSSVHAPSSLLRLATNKQDSNYLACIHLDSSTVQVLDARMPGSPISELKGHSATVNALTWSPTSSGHLCTGGDDCQVLVWDLRPSGSNMLSATASSRAKSAPVGLGTKKDPAYAYTAHYEVNQVAWSSTMPEWIAVAFGKSIQALRLN